MLINFSRDPRSARLAALALLAVCFFQPTVRNAHAATAGHRPEVNDEVVVLFSSIPIGLARGQTLRINVANVNKQRPCCVNNLKQFGIAIHNFHGDVIRRSDEIVIAPGKHHSFDFPRNEIPLAGEPTTGRIQVSVSCAVRTTETGDMDEFVASLEVMDSYSGSNVLYQDIFIPSPTLARPEVHSFDLATIGFVPGQTLRVTASNENAPNQPGTRSGPVRAQLKLLDPDGNQIHQSLEVVIPEGEFGFIDVDRGDISLSGESTGRLQVRPTILLQRLTNPRLPSDGESVDILVTSLEIFDNGTGITRARTSTFVQVDGRLNP